MLQALRLPAEFLIGTLRVLIHHLVLTRYRLADEVEVKTFRTHAGVVSFSFHVQLYNPDSLLACALPYHDTNLFVRVVQLLNLKEATNRWNWLRCLQVRIHPPTISLVLVLLCMDLKHLDVAETGRAAL